MQKQKKDRSSQKYIQKSNKCSHPRWNQQHFNQLYPITPQILTAQTFFVVGLHYHGSIIKVKLPTGVHNKHLHYLFHKQIYKYLLNIKDSNPLLKTAEVVGFQSVDSDLILDYQISIGDGVLKKKTSFNCLEYSDQQKLKKYKIYKCLAVGGFSKVYLVRSLRDGQFYAMKVILKKPLIDAQQQGIIQNEKEICKQLNHPFIVKLNHCFETHNFVCFIFDYCPGGQLFFHLKKVKRLSQNQAKFYFIEILYGLMYLHQQKIIYRDLKPQNLLINYDGHLKIADFGLSKSNMSQRQMTYSFCGSTQYMPPQMILRQGHSYGVDFYTLGALLYQLVIGLPPFYSRNEQQIKQAIINQQLTFPNNIILSENIKNLLSGLLNKNPKNRLGNNKGLKEILFHPWIGKINSQFVLSKKLIPPYKPSTEEFSFGQNQLGQNQFQFIHALTNQHLIPPLKEKNIFQNFEFKNQNHILPQVKQIYQNYPDRNMLHSPSLKQLKSGNYSYHHKSNFKRQQSSPYLLASISSIERPYIQKKLFRNQSLKIIKNINRSVYTKKNNQNAYIQLCKGSTGIIKKDRENKRKYVKKQKYIRNY